jgi:hypothetical protein
MYTLYFYRWAKRETQFTKKLCNYEEDQYEERVYLLVYIKTTLRLRASSGQDRTCCFSVHVTPFNNTENNSTLITLRSFCMKYKLHFPSFWKVFLI